MDEPLVVGILNVTPDSFSDGGELDSVSAVLARADVMAAAGAGMLDVGGESTRPGAHPVPEFEELRRVIPVVEALVRELDLPVSVDTRKAEVARQALEAGAAAVNDVSGLGFDPELGSVVARYGAGLILMHMRGVPGDMRSRTSYDDVCREVTEELGISLDRAHSAGIADPTVVLDPGIGFAKTTSQSLRLLHEVGELVSLGYPVMVGPSRKSFLGELLDVPPRERVVGTAVACALAWERGARLFRVHDVEESVQALKVATAINRTGDPGDPRGAPGVEQGRGSSRRRRTGEEQR